MKQYLLSNNATSLIEAIRENTDAYKSTICDAFADEVFNAISGTMSQRAASWRVLTQLQEYSHLIDCLSLTDSRLDGEE